MSRRSQRTRRRTRIRDRGRAFVLIGLVVALAIGVATLAWSQFPAREIVTDTSAPGRLVAIQPTIDLGRVPFDQMTEARFELDNTGGNLVRLVGAPKVRMLEGC